MIRDFTMTFEILAWNSIKTKSYSIVPRLFYCLSGQLIAKKFLSGPVVKAAAVLNVFFSHLSKFIIRSNWFCLLFTRVSIENIYI